MDRNELREKVIKAIDDCESREVDRYTFREGALADAVIRTVLESVAKDLRAEVVMHAPGPGHGLYMASLMVRSLLPSTDSEASNG